MIFVFFVAPVARAQSLRARMIAAEDARLSTDAAIEPLLQGLRGSDPALTVRATRALGRFEKPALTRHLLPLLTHARPEVRREAANAIGQAFASVPRAIDAPDPLPPEAATATTTLLARLGAERDPFVVGAIAEALGRLPFRAASAVRDVERALRGLLPPSDTEASARGTTGSTGPVGIQPGALAGVVKGLDTIVRVHQKASPPDPQTLARLRGVATLLADPSDADLAFIRRVAWLTVNTATAADGGLIERGIDDPDAQVRRLVVTALVNARAPDEVKRAVLTRALGDASFNVRMEAVRAYSRTLQMRDCGPIVKAVDDVNVHVALAAIDALGNGCPASTSVVPTLVAIADDTNLPWHKPAHAFVSLAKTSREEAVRRLPRFAEHQSEWMRAYAARGAAELLAAARLERMAADSSDNVRYEAIVGLRRVKGHDADTLFLDALRRRDYQLVMTAAQALEGTPKKAEAAPALVDAFTRITGEGRETSRDVRVALLKRVAELGSRTQAGALQRCLTDFDPVVANECVATIKTLTGVTLNARPMPAAPQPVVEPLPREARVSIRGRGSFTLRLLGEDATASVARFARLARQGYYNGLTIHRVVGNFVIQGGSPGANEYAGDGPFMRDEVGLRSNLRGTVGVSTRGRDTGDAQFFVNLLDNPRLDHEFTVFAEVAAGMDVVDAVLEGDVIDRIDVQ